MSHSFHRQWVPYHFGRMKAIWDVAAVVFKPEVYSESRSVRAPGALQLRKGTELNELLFYVLSLTDQPIVLFYKSHDPGNIQINAFLVKA